MTYLAQALGTTLMGVVSITTAAELSRMNQTLRQDELQKKRNFGAQRG